MLLVFECQRLLKGDLWCIHPVNKSLIGKHHGLFHPKQVFHAVFVCFVNQTCVRKISLLLFSLLRQNVTFVCMIFPVPVRANLFLAPELVFIFGILLFFFVNYSI